MGDKEEIQLSMTSFLVQDLGAVLLEACRHPIRSFSADEMDFGPSFYYDTDRLEQLLGPAVSRQLPAVRKLVQQCRYVALMMLDQLCVVVLHQQMAFACIIQKSKEVRKAQALPDTE